MSQSTYARSLAARYAPEDLQQRLRAALCEEALDPDRLDCDDIAAIDQLHVGGREASRRLLERAGVEPGARVLDLGCGTGGSARLLMAEYGLQVTGIDLTAGFVGVADWLTRATGMAASGDFVCGDAQRLPFTEGAFDLIWAQHVLLNVPDMMRVLLEAQRVLRPGGRILVHEVVAGDAEDALRFPVPWADSPRHSHLLEREALIERFTGHGFRAAFVDDITADGLRWRQKHSARERRDGGAVLGPALIFGEGFGIMASNLMENLAADRIRILQAGFVRR
ncbi:MULTISPECIES: class I SAM-dependent methyltransferase [unclassified Marichromatium]|uniref:class I SAM-dependent methyltransferase n=1 Tax=unclassified Marichromatium TaxID=2618417 RepID=UPI000F40D580|nr:MULTISPECIES: class I SAM-dependent methyltransferase [unclassified Marichromatium]RNE90101.1 class I SAM-dependent methyltransferase [Marichromatium sp. AB31]RNE94547.1 class I SAM-dependent methyltransferase [Marichromatium sp. AB32]